MTFYALQSHSKHKIKSKMDQNPDKIHQKRQWVLSFSVEIIILDGLKSIFDGFCSFSIKFKCF